MAVLTVCVSASILLFSDVLGIVMPVNFLPVISMQNICNSLCIPRRSDEVSLRLGSYQRLMHSSSYK